MNTCPHGQELGLIMCKQCKAEKLDRIENEMWNLSPAPDMEHHSVLLEANTLVNGDRAKAYGTPQENFGRWADLTKVVGLDLTPAQLAMVMVLGKLAREVNGHKRDNVVDACGYLEIYERLNEDPEVV